MGRRPSTDTSAIYGSFIVSMMCRSATIFDSRQPPTPDDAGVLDKVLQSAFNVPEIAQWASVGLEFLNTRSEVEWQGLALRGIAYVFRGASKAAMGLGQPNPFRGMSLDDRISWLLDELGWKNVSFEEAAWRTKEIAIGIFERVANSNQEELAAWCKEIVGDLFGADPRRAVATIKFCLLAFGGANLVSEADKAVRIVRDRLVSSPEFRAAVALSDKRHKWSNRPGDEEFEQAIEVLMSRMRARMRNKNLGITEASVDSSGRKTWAEEDTLAMDTVFGEFVLRVERAPFKLISDALNGRLAKSLVAAGEHDLLDAIRREKRTMKLGAGILDSLEDMAEREAVVKKNGSDRSRSPLAPEPIDAVIDEEARQQLQSRLTPEENEIADLKAKGYPQEEIARKLGKSQPWVSAKFKIMRGKLGGSRSKYS